MPTTLPVPIQFRLPQGWQAAPPEEVGASDVAFIALHPHPDAGFTANITIDGDYRPDNATLVDIADASVERLREVADSVVVTSRREIGSADAPGLTQRLALSAVSGDVLRDLVQSHVYLSMLDVGDPRRRAVIRMVLTATATQHDSIVGDFQDFLRTVRPDTGTGP
ncbi:hypothetical protein [Streptomyces violascens]|uniref:DUF1795 domain-containing protein n=1 Tax=Streptomyces violascens TaxID=67381 RepID=A0ABQ3QQF2_9ACTN|nr:hypothetical protein [Streptomyces violascens]GGU20507.1 hypothetical protein GCM10010289_47800 [Streptomyces violascens]GHI39499.1 hypothetical protein Sviol_39070 [Streptomyces violascens]